jgi:hypothetical protein
MSQVGAHIRSLAELKKALEDCKDDLDNLAQKSKLSSYQDLKFAFQNYDLLLAQYVYLTAFKNYIEQGGKSRGSYLIKDPDGQLPLADLAEKFRFSLDEDKMADLIQEVNYNNDQFEFKWRPVREIPTADNWFEKVWSDYLADQII